MRSYAEFRQWLWSQRSSRQVSVNTAELMELFDAMENRVRQVESDLAASKHSVARLRATSEDTT